MSLDTPDPFAALDAVLSKRKQEGESPTTPSEPVVAKLVDRNDTDSLSEAASPAGGRRAASLAGAPPPSLASLVPPPRAASAAADRDVPDRASPDRAARERERPEAARGSADPARASASQEAPEDPREEARRPGRRRDPAVARREAVRALLRRRYRSCDVTLYNVSDLLRREGFEATIAALCARDASKALGVRRAGAAPFDERELRAVLAPYAESLGVDTRPPEPIFAAPIEAARRKRQ